MEDVIMMMNCDHDHYAKDSKVKHYAGSVPTGSMMDYVADMYLLPEDLTVRTVRNGRSGSMQDGERISSYFRNAMHHIQARCTKSR